MVSVTGYDQAEDIGNIVLANGVLKRSDSVVCRDILGHIYLEMDEDITLVTYEKRCGLKRTPIVVGGDTAYMHGFSLDCDNWNVV